MVWGHINRAVVAYERFLRFDEITTASDLLKGRAVYLVGYVFALTQAMNLVFMTISYGGWTKDHAISVATSLAVVALANGLRYYKSFTTYALIYSAMIFMGIAASAIPDQTGINSALIPILVSGILLNGFITNWRWVVIYSGMAVVFIFMLYINALGSAGAPVDWASRTQQRAIQAGLAIALVCAIVCLFTINLHRLFANLEDKIEATRRAESVKSQFLANMSHELRTPLNGVIGMAQLLMRTDMNETQTQYVQIINGCSRGLVAIINDVLDLSKLDAGKIDLSPVGFDLRKMLGELMDMHRPRALEKSIDLVLDMDPAMPLRYFADESRLRQVINNLLGNAVKFTDSGSVSIHVRTVSVSTHSVRVGFYVRDTGIGIPAEHQARVFERFEQVDNTTTSAFQGTGLGLAISRDLVRVFGGDLKLASQEGAGTTFAFAIPLDRDRRAEDRSNASAIDNHPGRRRPGDPTPPEFDPRLLRAS